LDSLLLISAFVGIIVGLIVAPYYLRRSRQKTREALDEYRDEVYEAAYSFSLLRSADRYVSKSEYGLWKENWGYLNHLLRYRENLIKLNLDYESELIELLDALSKGRSLINKSNQDFIRNELEKYSDFFDTIESNPLTENQRTAIVTDEMRNLVVAGAGTGKTSTIVGKAGYLIESGLARPEELLLISFARGAKDEMSERVQSRLGKPLRVETFHGLGLDIIAEVEGRKPSLSELSSDSLKLRNAVEGFIQDRSSDTSFLNRLNQYFSFHSVPYESIFDFKTLGEYYDYLRNHQVRSLKGDLVKSYEECSIANLLYLNGVDYQYEPFYEVDTATREHRQYRPDFYLPEYGLYIEHFGIDKNGNTAPYVDRRKYHDDMRWKRETHRENSTTLIETYSWWSSEGVLLDQLEDILSSRGVVFNQVPTELVFNRINELGLVGPFSGLVTTFLNLFKSSRRTIAELEEKSHRLPDSSRYLAFLDLFRDLYNDYEQSLGSEIDFNDMITRAEEYVSSGRYVSDYTYILVDEFQDISYGRYKLLKALVDQNSSAKLFCVGDDWQSIYRFTGSDISIMTDFNDHFDPSETLSLDKTFRFDNKLCEFSSKFIQKNPNQIRKEMTTQTTSELPAVSLLWSDEPEVSMEGILRDLNDRLEHASVYIIGRYNHLRPERLSRFKREFRNLEVDFITAHSSKGVQRDFVIVTGLSSYGYAFPSQIVDDPILELVLAKKEKVSNAEERRLFYVAITRARKHVFLIASERTPSVFAVEVATDGYEILLDGQRGASEGSCPICETGVILHRMGDYGEFYSCSNYPYCAYRPRRCQRCNSGFLLEGDGEYTCSNDKCNFKAQVCPECKDGFLVERMGPYSTFYGCINYPDCRYTKEKYPRSRRSRRRY
jgi:DNA helicase-4